MPGFPPEVEHLRERCIEPGLTATERGRALEDLIAGVFAAIPGVEVRARNAKSVFENEELDLVMANRGASDGLPFPGSYFSVECKNWSRPVGSTEVSWFATKLRRTSQSFGVLVAANGVTGRPADLTAAHFEAATALNEGQAVVVLTLKELRWLCSGEELANLLTEKHACLIARKELRVQEDGPGSSRLPRVPRPPLTRSERDEVLAALSVEVAESPDLIRSIDVTIAEYRRILEAFLETENREPEPRNDDPAYFDHWAEANGIAFENLGQALRRVGRACIATLRSRPGMTWPVEHLALGLDTRAPNNLEAPPDSELATLLIDHWTGVLRAAPSYEHDAAILCLLGWAIEWLIAMETERWPPPWV
jgi:hypothetical protein